MTEIMIPTDKTSSSSSSASQGDGGSPTALRDYLTVEQAALHLQVSQSSIRSYIRQGYLKAFRVAGLRKVLIPKAELLSLLEPARSTGEA